MDPRHKTMTVLSATSTSTMDSITEAGFRSQCKEETSVPSGEPVPVSVMNGTVASQDLPLKLLNNINATSHVVSLMVSRKWFRNRILREQQYGLGLSR
ncbi:hypothetical protein V5799_024202 [Amblyomma americanum]|uniref:Uncharacterized protein n=1 Tax=Amblyomma americanum TaxID=6943 RepID=A0AAQ4ECS3_AMBAM